MKLRLDFNEARVSSSAPWIKCDNKTYLLHYLEGANNKRFPINLKNIKK
jgi:hypothetical protein